MHTALLVMLLQATPAPPPVQALPPVYTLSVAEGELGYSIRRVEDRCVRERDAACLPFMDPAAPARLTGIGPTSALVQALEKALNITIADQTGLEGIYAYRVSHDRTRPDVGLEQLVREQLGLRLVRIR